MRARLSREGEAITSFSTGLRPPAAKVAVAAFVVVDLILVYRLTVDDSPAPLTTVPGGVGASSIQQTATDEFQKALATLNEEIGAVKLFGIHPSRTPRESTHRTRPGGSKASTTESSSGSRGSGSSGSGSSAVSSGSGSSTVSSGSGGSVTSSGSGDGSASSGSGGSSTGSSGSSGGGGPGGGGLTGGGTGGGDATGDGGGGGGGG